ncbi:MAG TPA: hypothetical protein DCP58_11410 [Verrucomicrobiales bacterium]|nr:hypothetical protein [Verrucomicrobiales bacterium]
MIFNEQQRTRRLAKRKNGRAASAPLGSEDGWGQPSLPTLGQAFGFENGLEVVNLLSPEGAECDSPGRQPRGGRAKIYQALNWRHNCAIELPCRGSVMECGSPYRFQCGTAGTKAVRSTALQDAGAESWQSQTLTSVGLETEN